MELVNAKCTSCAAPIKVNPNVSVLVCRYCGSEFVVSEAIKNYNVSISNSVINNDIQNATFIINNGENKKNEVWEYTTKNINPSQEDKILNEMSVFGWEIDEKNKNMNSNIRTFKFRRNIKKENYEKMVELEKRYYATKKQLSANSNNSHAGVNAFCLVELVFSILLCMGGLLLIFVDWHYVIVCLFHLIIAILCLLGYNSSKKKRNKKIEERKTIVAEMENILVEAKKIFIIDIDCILIRDILRIEVN